MSRISELWKRYWALLLAPTAVLCFGGCPISSGATRVSAIALPDAQFNAYRSYAFADPAVLPSSLRRYDFPDRDMNKIRLLAHETMMDRGFQMMPPEQADLLLYVSVGERTRTDTDQGDAQYAVWHARLAELDARAQRHTVVVDAVERSSRKHVWQGRSPLVAERHETTVAANEIQSILAELPEAAEFGAPATAPVEPVDSFEDTAFGEPLEPSGTGVPTGSEDSPEPSFSDEEFEEAAPRGTLPPTSETEFDEEFDESATADAEAAPATDDGALVSDDTGASDDDDGGRTEPTAPTTTLANADPPSDGFDSEFDDEF